MQEITKETKAIAIHDSNDQLIVMMTLVDGKLDTLSTDGREIVYMDGIRVTHNNESEKNKLWQQD